MSGESAMSWIRDTVVPAMLVDAPDWKGTELIDCQISPMATNDGFASDLLNMKLCLGRNDKQDVYELIVKIMIVADDLYSRTHMRNLFSNEIHVYSNVIPLFSSLSNVLKLVQSIFPKGYYAKLGQASDSKNEDTAIILENLKHKGFRLGNRVSLDIDHTLLALKTLGQYHAFSLALKQQNKEAFHQQVISKVQNTFHYEKQYGKIVRYCGERVKNYFNKISPEDNLAEKLFSKSTDSKMLYMLLTPKEPLAVFCHGDFCRNNMLFRYDETNKPCEVKFIDFQTVKYASPAIDLSFFLYMNAPSEYRRHHMDQLIEAYHSEVCKTLAKMLGKDKDDLDSCYSLEAFKEDFRQHVVYGYTIALSFLPFMMVSDEERDEILRTFKETLEPEEEKRIFIEVGGDEVTNALVTLAEDMRQFV